MKTKSEIIIEKWWGGSLTHELVGKILALSDEIGEWDNALKFISGVPDESEIQLFVEELEIRVNAVATICCVCNSKEGKEVCDDCNKIYSNIIGATFDTKEEIEHFFDNEDVPNWKLKKLSDEMDYHLNY